MRYRTITELIGQQLSFEEKTVLKNTVYESKAVQTIFTKIVPDKSTSTGAENIGEGFCFTHLVEFAADSEYPPMDRLAERIIQKNMRHNFGDYPCGDALLLRAFVLAGYRNHPDIVKFLDHITACARSDGGFLCLRPIFNGNTKSCIHGSLNMLLLYSCLPELWETPSCKNLVQYFLERRIYFKRGDFSVKVKGDLRTILPFNLRQGILEPLYALSKMGFGKYTELDDAWHLLDSKCMPEDRYILDWTPPKTYLMSGTKEKPSKWITLYALLAKKYRDITV